MCSPVGRMLSVLTRLLIVLGSVLVTGITIWPAWSLLSKLTLFLIAFGGVLLKLYRVFRCLDRNEPVFRASELASFPCGRCFLLCSVQESMRDCIMNH